MNQPGTVATDLSSFALILVVLVALLVSSLAWIARPWDLPGGRLIDRLRIADALLTYDLHLSLRGVPGRRRRALRDELQANLWDATTELGSKAALARVGSLRALAKAASAVDDDSPRRPASQLRWGRGLFVGALALELVVILQVLSATVVADTALAAGVDRVTTDVALLPGTSVTFESVAAQGFSVETSFGLLPLVVAVLALLSAAGVWRWAAASLRPGASPRPGRAG